MEVIKRGRFNPELLENGQNSEEVPVRLMRKPTNTNSSSSQKRNQYLKELNHYTGTSYVTSDFGENRLKGRHEGIDLGTHGQSTAIFAPVSGTIVTYPTSEFNTIGIKDEYGLTHQFLHNSYNDPSLKTGTFINFGSYLGNTGNVGVGVTGTITGIHSHYLMRTGNGSKIDPFLGNNITRSISAIDAITNLNTNGHLESSYSSGIGTMNFNHFED